MKTAKPRNRVVIFRLTQEEYAVLQLACSQAGARNLSDYTRSELLSIVHSDPIEQHLRDIEDRLTELQSRVTQLSDRLFALPVLPKGCSI